MATTMLEVKGTFWTEPPQNWARLNEKQQKELIACPSVLEISDGSHGKQWHHLQLVDRRLWDIMAALEFGLARMRWDYPANNPGPLVLDPSGAIPRKESDRQFCVSQSAGATQMAYSRIEQCLTQMYERDRQGPTELR